MRLEKGAALEQLGIQPAGKLLVVFGGSQGASSLNQWAKDNCKTLAEKNVSVYCLTGLRNELPGEVVNDTPEHGPVKSWFVPFSDAMPAVLSAADVVVSRAGAGSIGEIIRCQAPSVLIPYPFARDDHQSANAQYVVNHQAALVVKDAQLDTLLEVVSALLFDTAKAEEIRSQLRQLDRPDEAKALADSLEALMPSALGCETASSIPHNEA